MIKLRMATTAFFSRCLGKRPGATLFCIAVLTNTVLEALSRRSVVKVFTALWDAPEIFLLNVCVITLSLAFALLFRKKAAPLLLVLCLWLALGITNFIVLGYRANPLTAIDIILLRSVWDVLYVYLAPWQILLIAVGICAFVTGLVFFWIKTPRIPVKPQKTAVLLFLTVAAVFILVPYTSTAENEETGTSDIYGSYEEDGFAFSFCSTFFDRGIEKPDGYSAEAAAELYKKLGDSQAEAEYNAGDDRDTASERRPNIIVLQLESYFDVNSLTGTGYSSDPVPVLTELKKSAACGMLTVPVLGAGTANTEFEVLCGISSLLFGTGEYPYDTVLRRVRCENIASGLAKIGYRSTAVHNNAGSFYDRDKVFAGLGFDDFISLEDMPEAEKNPLGWAKDAVLTDAVLSALDATEQKDFVFCISVQAHGKYIDEGRMGVNSGIDAYNIPDPEEETGFEYYLSQVSGTDAFVGELLDALEKREEPTVVLLYGDHLPSFNWTENDISSGSLYQTDYLIWSNYGAGFEAPDVYAYQLYATLLMQLDIDTGAMARLTQRYKDAPGYISDMRLLAYDMLYGFSAVELDK